MINGFSEFKYETRLQNRINHTRNKKAEKWLNKGI